MVPKGSKDLSKYRIEPSKTIHGEIEIPPSKSHTLRAILFSLLAKGTSKITRFLDSSDAHSMIHAIEQFGAIVERKKDTLTIESKGLPLPAATDVINAGNSGLVLRLFGAVSALSPHYTIITGDESIRVRRPAAPLLDGLKQLGAFAESSKGDGYAPLIIKGPLKKHSAKIDGRDSQPVSGLLIASAFSEGTTQIYVENPGEKPWIDLTLYWLEQMGVQVEKHGYEHLTVHGVRKMPALNYVVPGDWSSALFPLAAALVTQSPLKLTYVDFNDVQGDKLAIPMLQQMGAKIQIDELGHSLLIDQKCALEGGEYDINHMIDALPILSVIGLFGKTPLQLTNASIAREKESDRIAAMEKELRKMGAQIDSDNDSITIYPSKLHGATVYSHKDHRIAMALSIAALKAEGETIIEEVECVAKTFPNFDQAMQSIGIKIKRTP